MSVAVCIPWRPSKRREPPYRRVREFWEATGWPIYTADSDSRIFSASQARNNAVRQADAEVVVVADADSIPPMKNVKAAVQNPQGFIWPFTRTLIIDGCWTGPLSKARVQKEYDGIGGVTICHRSEYLRVGGQPEEFYGWGYEVMAFHVIAQTLSTTQRIPGVLYSLNHNNEDGRSDSPCWDRDRTDNEVLLKPYLNAMRRPWLMRELLSGRI